jgi:hypothetical protein
MKAGRIMMNLFQKIVAPGVDHVDLYQDDDDPLRFWMVPQRVRAATMLDGTPELTLIAFARDLALVAGVTDPLPQGETEGGLLSFTVECTVSEQDQAKIVEYLKNQVLSGAVRLQRPIVIDGRVTVQWREPVGGDPTLAYPTWLDGQVQFCLPSANGLTFVDAGQVIVKPSLTSSNVASFSILLGQEGVRLFREGMNHGKLPANLAYTLQYVARVPSVDVEISGDSTQTYQQLKEHSTITETSGGNVVRQYPQVSSLKELKDMCAGLTVTYNRYDLGQGDDALQTSIENFVLEITTGYLKNMFCQPLINGQLDPTALGTDPMQNFKPAGTPVTGGNQLWLKDFEQSGESHFGLSFSGSIAKGFSAYPNCSMLDVVSIEQIKQSYFEADLNTPIFEVLQVPVRVTADFQHDPIAAIQVTLDYQAKNDSSGQMTSKSATYDFLTGNEVYYFRTSLARAADHSPKDSYTFSSKVHYKAAQQSTEFPPQTTRDKSLMLGYDRMGCVEVKAVAGDIPWTVVESAELSLRLPGSVAPDASTTILLTSTSTEGQWFTFTGNTGATTYAWSCTFRLKNGKRLSTPEQRSTAGVLRIDSPFAEPMSVTFAPVGAFPPLQSILLSTSYDDPAHDYHLRDAHNFTNNTDLWPWTVQLIDAGTRAFRWKADLTFVNGTTTEGQWQDGQEGTIRVGEVLSSVLDIDISAAVIDWAQWKLVVVKLRYEDPTTHALQTQTVQLTPASGDQHWQVSLTDQTATTYSYAIEAYGAAGVKKELAATTSTDKLLVVEL